MGAWIETYVIKRMMEYLNVAPYVGAWIETLYVVSSRTRSGASLPTWERGLKLRLILTSMMMKSRSLRGSVD